MEFNRETTPGQMTSTSERVTLHQEQLEFHELVHQFACISSKLCPKDASNVSVCLCEYLKRVGQYKQMCLDLNIAPLRLEDSRQNCHYSVYKHLISHFSLSYTNSMTAVPDLYNCSTSRFLGLESIVSRDWAGIITSPLMSPVVSWC